jgi:aspartyl-tRNA(Asn)/glutamyl-tRNA(Gln) amidotransferase subunit A
MPLDLTTLTLAGAARGLRDGAFTSVDLTEAALARIEADDARINAFITVTATLARAQALQADAERSRGVDRGALHGIPISVKDLFDLEGTPTTAASRVREGHVAETDAVAVARLRAAGAVFVGKTNMHEFALGTTSEDSAFGAVHHPLDPSRSAGGSSGGSAASVIAGMCLATIGSDTGGSIRIPAAVCGLVGLKPAFGELSCEGVYPLSVSLDHIGPLARTVEDARLFYTVLRGETAGLDTVAPPAAVGLPPGGLRLGIPRGYFFDKLQPEVRASFDRALEQLTAAGVVTDIVSVTHAADAPSIYLPICLREGFAVHAPTLETMPDRYTAPVRERFLMGGGISAENEARARAAREVFRQDVEAALGDRDALVLPTLPIVAPPLGAATVPMETGEEPVRTAMLRLTQPFNLSRHPAITLPIAPSPAGLPIGLQLVGRDTARLLEVAASVERALRER